MVPAATTGAIAVASPGLQISAPFVDNDLVMVDRPLNRLRNDDPRKLRVLLGRVSELASDHRLSSVVVGMAGFEGDPLFPEIVDFVESALRVDDSIVRITRERSVLFLTDVDRDGAERIVERILSGFCERFCPAEDPAVSVGYFEVTPASKKLTVKEVLPALFASPLSSH